MRFATAVLALCLVTHVVAQTPSAPAPEVAANSHAQEIQELRTELAHLSARLDTLEHSEAVQARSEAAQAHSEAAQARSESAGSLAPAPANVAGTVTPAAPEDPPSSGAVSRAVMPAAATAPVSPPGSALSQAQPPAPSVLSVLPTNLPGGATLNYTFDGYYEYNFNQPPGRVNELRAYDVLSNVISINQADVIFELDPDVSKGRRYGARIDLQFGQATDTLQGNPANEPRPDVYRNLFQVYGTYVVPLGKGLNMDFGKWASSLGYEGNYTKDQMNYTRSFYFYFLPFYHTGVRTSYHFNDKFAVNYWIVNGANQSEPTNGFKDELFGFTLQPTKAVTWTSNYYLGQEHADSARASDCTGPVQPGLCVTPINPAPNGKLHIIDNYVTWQAMPKLNFVVEGDYVIQREWAKAGPGQSSAPSHVAGGAGYAQFQATPRTAFAARAEYLSDRGGLFSGTTQALKEVTGTYKYSLGDGLDAFIGFRRDWSNAPYFTTHIPGSPAGHQTTTTLGLVWWYGGKQGAW